MKPFPASVPVSIYQLPMAMSVPSREGLAAKRWAPLPDGVAGSCAGWVSSQQPEGGDFTEDDLMAGTFGVDKTAPVRPCYWWRLRVDTRAVPKDVMDIRLEAAEHERGRKLTKREKREIKDAVTDELLPTLPARSRFIHVVVCGDLVIAGTTSATARKSFEDLWGATFSTTSQLTRVTWDRDGDQPHHLLNDILACSIAKWERYEPDEFVFDGAVSVQTTAGEKVSIDAGELAAIRTDAFRDAMADQAMLRSAKFTVAIGDRIYRARVDCWSGTAGLKLPDAPDDMGAEDRSSQRVVDLVEFAANWSRFCGMPNDDQVAARRASMSLVQPPAEPAMAGSGVDHAGDDE